ncbi:MAG TPA: hypothetical protein VF530_16330, partial [Planctomycetota bacterium]
MRTIQRASAAALLLGALGTLLGVSALAQIRSFTLEEMVQHADQAIHGQILASRVERIDSPIDGPELYYTTLT